jgi:serine/threonine protein kinase
MSSANQDAGAVSSSSSDSVRWPRLFLVFGQTLLLILKPARFQREAEVLASLNHPNIAQIYGVEERALVVLQTSVGPG